MTATGIVGYNQGTAITLDATFTVDGAPTDPTTVTFRVRQPDSTLLTYVYGTDTNVTKISVGVYECLLQPPDQAGEFQYDAVGTGTVVATLPGNFYVIPSSVDDPNVGSGPQAGPCTVWVDGSDIAEYLQEAEASSDVRLYDQAAVAASQVLFEISGRQFAGTCQQTVRPCQSQCGAWPAAVAGWPSQWWGFGFSGLGGAAGGGWGWWGGDGAALCGCQPLSQVKLPGYPVTAIVSVKIDGAVLAAVDGDGDPNYRLDEASLLTRLAKPGSPAEPRFWPSCQNLALGDTEPGTFAVTYRYGTPPPLPGVLAAQELGAEIYNALAGSECRLPVGASQVTRQGVTINRGLLVNWALAQSTRGGAHPRSWATGLPLVDMFLSAYNPFGHRQRSRVFSPDLQQYARHLGTG